MVTDPTIVEAVAMLRASATIKTHSAGAKILAILDDFFANDKLMYVSNLGGTVYGESFDNFLWGRLRINEAFSGDPETTSAVVAHELIHLSLALLDEFDEEIQCREFDARYLTEIIGGFSFPDPATTGAFKTAKLTTASQLWAHYQRLLNAAKFDQLIDTILAVHTYDKHISADWVVKHVDDYGGLGNRWATSLGKFVGALVCADARPAHYAPTIVKVLQAIPGPYWAQAKPALGEFNRFAAMMTYIEKLSVANGAAIAALEQKFGEKLRLF